MATVPDADDVISVVMTTTTLNATEAASSSSVAVLSCDVPEMLATVITLGAVILATVIGNMFVIAAVVLERNLRSHVANYLVASLAVADLLVALLVMPLAAVNEVSSKWFLGRAVCDAWTTLDLICCTSSILHLLAISVDRYWAVTRLDYIHHRSTRRIVAMIAASWGGSVIISAPPLFIHNPPNSDPDLIGECIINQNLAYTVFSTVGAFYLPFALMMIVYFKVFRAARARIRRKLFRTQLGPETGGLTRLSPERSRVTTHPPSVTNGDLEPDDQFELEPETGYPVTVQQEQIHGMVTVRVSDADRENAESVVSEEPLDNDVLDHHDKPVVVGRSANARRFSGAVSNEVEAITGGSSRPRRLGCRSESDVLGKQCWTADDEAVSTRSETISKRALTLTLSCDNDPSPVTTDTDQRLHDIDDVFEMPVKPEENRIATGSSLHCPNGRAAELGTAGAINRLVITPVCSITSSVDQCPSSDHHCYVEDSASGQPQHLCLPRKAADRLLTPNSTPIHRSSWVDLTRALFPSTAALRIHFHGPTVAGRAAGRTTRQMLEQRRERKAARTLAVITGTFVLCWLPFFIIAILRPFCGDHCHYPAPLISVIVWLGYANSLLNPIIYTVFNADFRSAFRKILFGKYRYHRRR